MVIVLFESKIVRKIFISDFELILALAKVNYFCTMPSSLFFSKFYCYIIVIFFVLKYQNLERDYYCGWTVQKKLCCIYCPHCIRGVAY